MTPSSWQALFINPLFNTQLQHNRRHSEISELSFLFNCFRPLSRSIFSHPPLLSFFLHCCFLFFLPLIPHFISPSLSPLSLSLIAKQPSPGQLLIRGRNDRCFAHQQCHLFCLSTNSRCAVHIYFSGSKEHTYLHIYKCIHAHTHTHKHILSSSVNSLRHSDAESRLKYNRFCSLHFASACVQVSGYYCVSRHLAAPPAHWWLSSTMNTVVTVGVGFLEKTLTRGTGESEDCNTGL